MLIIVHAPTFNKRFGLLSKKLKHKTLERLTVFREDPFDSLLNNHQLHGEYTGCRSINITGDIRLIYQKLDDEKYILLDVGTHNQLYE